MIWRVLRAGLLTGVTDGLFSGVLSAFFYGSTVTRLFQGVASTVIGPRAIDGGTGPFVLGLLMHFGVALGWSAVFLLLVTKWAWFRRVRESPNGVVKAGALFGPSVWLVMSLIVIPLLTQRPPAITFRWWVQFIGHYPFVGVPISLGTGVDNRQRQT